MTDKHARYRETHRAQEHDRNERWRLANRPRKQKPQPSETAMKPRRNRRATMSKTMHATQPVTGTEPLIVRMRDAMQMLSTSRATIYELIDTGDLESVKDGKLRKITAASIHAYVAKLIAATPTRGERVCITKTLDADWVAGAARQTDA